MTGTAARSVTVDSEQRRCWTSAYRFRVEMISVIPTLNLKSEVRPR